MSVLYVSPLKAPREGRCQTLFQRNAPAIKSALKPRTEGAERRIQPRSIAANSGRNYGCTIECCGVLQGGHADCMFVERYIECRFRSLPGDVGYSPIAARVQPSRHGSTYRGTRAAC